MRLSKEEAMSKTDVSRRDFVKKAAYIAPAIISLQAYSAAAKAGSAKPAEVESTPRRRRKRPRR